MGKVEARIYEDKGIKGPRSQTSTSFSPSRTTASSRKSVVTEEGSIQEDAVSVCDVKLGRKLGSIKLKYCTIEGLMEAGVVPRYRKGNERDRKRKKRSSVNILVPTKLRKRTTISNLGTNGGEVVETTEYDHFDLTQLPESDDEEGK